MTNESVKGLISAFNNRNFPSFVAMRKLTDSVVLGYVWMQHPTGRSCNETSKKIYFILSGGECVGAVVAMGFGHTGDPIQDDDLHWYMLEEHRRKGHLHSALRNCILPHVFSDDRDSQRVSVDSADNASYVARQGFTRVDESIFTISRQQVDVSNAPLGTNTPLSDSSIAELKSRMRLAKALVMSVHETLQCHYGNDQLCLDELSKSIEDQAVCLSDLDEHGKLSN